MQAIIRVTGTQTLEGEAPDTIELTTRGTFCQTADGWEISYDETEATALLGTTTTLYIADGRVTIERTGSHPSVLVLERHRRHHANYTTPYGVMDLGTYAEEFRYDLTPQGGSLEFTYTLGFNATVQSRHTVHIEIQEEV